MNNPKESFLCFEDLHIKLIHFIHKIASSCTMVSFWWILMVFSKLSKTPLCKIDIFPYSQTIIHNHGSRTQPKSKYSLMSSTVFTLRWKSVKHPSQKYCKQNTYLWNFHTFSDSHTTRNTRNPQIPHKSISKVWYLLWIKFLTQTQIHSILQDEKAYLIVWVH